jgi:hypothetical protein
MWLMDGMPRDEDTRTLCLCRYCTRTGRRGLPSKQRPITNELDALKRALRRRGAVGGSTREGDNRNIDDTAVSSEDENVQGAQRESSEKDELDEDPFT